MSTESSASDNEMCDHEYRHGLVSAQFDIDLPLQIRALRKQRNWTQPELAALAEMKQPRISAIEKPGGANFTLETLRRLAKAFDVALIVRFAPFGELSDWSKQFNPDNFHIPSFKDDPAFKEPQQPEATVLDTYSFPGGFTSGFVAEAVWPASLTTVKTKVVSIESKSQFWINTVGQRLKLSFQNDLTVQEGYYSGRKSSNA